MPTWNKYTFGYKNNNKTKRNKITERLCRICGKPVTGGNVCQSCSDFIKQKRHGERQAKK